MSLQSLILRGLACSVLLLAAATSPGALAQKLVIAGWGGPFEPNLRKELIREFEQKNNVTVEWISASSFQNYGRIKSQAANPQVDILLCDDLVQDQARRDGLLASLDPKIVTNLGDMKPEARLPGDVGVGFGYTPIGLVYNEKALKAANIPAPTSWNDLFRPELKGRIVMRQITSSYGLYPMLILGKMNGGGENNIEPAMQKMKQLAPNVIEFVTSGGKESQLLLQDEAWVGGTGPAEALALMQRGAPMKYVIPKEGTINTVMTASVVKGAPNAKLAQEFVNALISPRGQVQSVIATSFAPLSTKAVMTPEARAALPFNLDEPMKSFTIDFVVVSRDRPGWTERFNKEISGK